MADFIMYYFIFAVSFINLSIDIEQTWATQRKLQCLKIMLILFLNIEPNLNSPNQKSYNDRLANL